MPAAIPLVASYAATALAVGEGVVLAGSLGAALIGGAAAIGSSLVIAKVSAPDLSAGLTQPGAARTQQFRQPTAPHDVVVGRIKKSGPIMFVYSAPDDTGRADGYLYMVHALAAHHCRAIGDIYIGADFSTDSKFTGLVRQTSYLGTTTQAADADFVSETAGQWTADHRLRGRTVLYSRLKGNAIAFPSGVPNVSAIVWGADEITDPRMVGSPSASTIGWTNNAALIIHWWMTWGEGYDPSDFDQDTLIAAANVCDERVLVLQGTAIFAMQEYVGSPTTYTGAAVLADGSRSLDVGDGVRVSASGALPTGLAVNTTYYVIPSAEGSIEFATSVANAFAGTAIALSDPGSGTLTLTCWDEARYKINGSFTLDAAKSDVRDQLLTACAGYAVEIGGMWFLHAGAAATPTVTLDEDDLRAAMVTVPKRSMRDRFNGVRAVFVNPDNAWQPSDAPPLLSATYFAEDNDCELYQDIQLPFTTSARAAQRLMKIYLERNRRQRTVKFPAKLTAMRLRPLDGVYVSNTRYGWAAEQHQVMGWMLSEDGGIDLQLQNDDAGVYAWSASEEQAIAAPQAVTLPDPTHKTVGGLDLQANAVGFTVSGGSTTSKSITVTNDATVSGTNTGDQTSIVGITGSLAEFNAALTGADFATGGGTATGTNTGDQTNITGNAATVTTNANLTGPITSTGNTTAVAAQTGTGSVFAMQAVPSFSTTVGVGAATASASGAGVSFPATQSASTDANTLDDYEEGTFTGTLTAATPPTTPITANVAYTKIGRKVTLHFKFNNVNTTGAVGAMSITGSPFTCNASFPAIGAYAQINLGTDVGVCQVDTGQTKIEFVLQASAGAINISAGASRYLFGTITLFV